MEKEITAAAITGTYSPAGLCALVYCSSAVRIPTRAELLDLVTKAQSRNELEAVTGVLIYSRGSFVQYLEGPEPSVHRVYGRILKDPRHNSIIEVFREPIAAREFAEWSMAFAPGLLSVEARHFPLSQRLEERLREVETSICGARHLLRACWNEGASDVKGGRL